MKRLTISLLAVAFATSAHATPVPENFESYTVGSLFSGVAGQFSVQTLGGDSLIITAKVGTYTPSLPGLGGNTIWINAPTRDFEFVFDKQIDFFELYVTDAEAGEIFEVRSDTGLIASVTLFGSGPGGPVRRIQLGSIGGTDVFSRVLIDDQTGGGPGPYDLLTFNPVSIPEPSTLGLLGAGLMGLSMCRRRVGSRGAHI